MRRAKRIAIIILYFIFILIACIILTTGVYAREGDSGYEGGISSGESPGKTLYDYSEVCFISGQPVAFKGTLTIRKSLKQNTVNTTYTYNLKNVDKSAVLTRTLQYNTVLTKKDNGQVIEETGLVGRVSEVVRINNITYTLGNYDFTRSNLIDAKPAINYYAGNIWGRKVYRVSSSGAGGGTGTVTVVTTGNFYGYDQYWGTTEVIILKSIIQSELKKGDTVDKWGGQADITLTSTSTKQLMYVKNEPDQISFEGGYVQTQYNNSVMEYDSKLPELDSNGISTDNMISSRDSLKLETFPVQKRLAVPAIKHLRGHWAEEDIKKLYSLEVFKGDESVINPEQYMTRAEFATAIVQAAREVLPDPALASSTANRSNTVSKKTKQQIVSPFSDVAVDSEFFNQINDAYNRGLISGVGSNIFMPDGSLIVADAITVFIKALGLEGLAPNPGAVTTLKDNDSIPAYARDAVYIAEKIGLVKRDEAGYIHPRDKLTKAKAARLINNFIDYMREGIRKDYRERVIDFK